MTQYRMYIDGAFVTGQNQQAIEVVNPATGDFLAHVPDATAQEVDAAVTAASRAQPAWGAKPAIERANYIHAIADKVREHTDEIADIIVREQGKIRALAKVEVSFTADYLDYMAQWARRIEGEIITSDRVGESILMLRKPLGVVAGILPWNFPFFLIARKLAPALVTGNTIVIKPSEETPLNAFRFAELVNETDLPKGVFNLVSGQGQTTGHYLTDHPVVDMISFTGSVPTGSAIMKSASRHLTRVNLELGGKAPAIVLDDADLDLAAEAIVASRIINSGQVCNCAERLYVQRGVAEQLIDKLTARMRAIRVGDPSVDESVEMGPLINPAAVQKVEKMVAAAAAQGANVVCGGGVMDSVGSNYFEPTILANCNADMDVMTKEVFGPVLPIQLVDDLQEAIRLANDTEYGLTSSVYTRDLSKAMQASYALNFGETYINRENFEAMQGFHAGRKKSGIGGADGKHGLYEYMETHVIYMNHGVLS